MAGLRGQTREPRADARARRNAANLGSASQFVSGAEVITITGDGYFSLTLAVAGGLENSSGSLQINLDTNPGLVLSSSGIKVLTPASSGLTIGATGVLIDLDTNPGLVLAAGGIKVLTPSSSGITVGSSGVLIDLDTDPGLALGAGGITIDLDTDPGLVLGSGGLKILLDGNSLALGASGLRISAPETSWTVTEVKTGDYTAAIGECVRCDNSADAFIVTLPTAVGNSGRSIMVKNVTSSVLGITVDGDGSETIDGIATSVVTAAFGVHVVVSDGANWMIASKF